MVSDHYTQTGHLLGARYHDWYWRAEYTVQAELPDGRIVVIWEDGHETVHRTRLDGRDRLLARAGD